MRQFFLFLTTVTFFLNGEAQVIISPQIPSPGAFTKPQLWNLAMMNSTGQNIGVRLRMSIYDQQTNQLVLTGMSRNFSLSAGASHLTQNDLSPIIYQSANPSFAVDNTPNGFLPVGAFNICFEVISQKDDGLENIAEECQTVDVEPISPPQLILPADSEKINTNKPLFTWTPPLPYQFFNGLTYDLTLVEVAAYQTASEAAQINVPIWRKSGIYQTQIQYPEVLPVLDTGKLYAWKVQASNNLLPVSGSEVWSFRVQPQLSANPAKQTAGSYVQLHESENGIPVRVQGLLRFQFDNRDNQPSLAVKLFSLSGSGKKRVELPVEKLQLHYGKNLLELNFDQLSSLKDNSSYQLQVQSGTRKMYLTFQYRKP